MPREEFPIPHTVPAVLTTAVLAVGDEHRNPPARWAMLAVATVVFTPPTCCT